MSANEEANFIEDYLGHCLEASLGTTLHFIHGVINGESIIYSYTCYITAALPVKI